MSTFIIIQTEDSLNLIDESGVVVTTEQAVEASQSGIFTQDSLGVLHNIGNPSGRFTQNFMEVLYSSVTSFQNSYKITVEHLGEISKEPKIPVGVSALPLEIFDLHMDYGNFRFNPQPLPLVTITKEYIKTPNQQNIGATINVTLEGNIVRSTGGVLSNILDVDDSIDSIRNAFNEDGKLFQIYCSGDLGNATVFFSGYPIIRSIQFDRSSNNWVQTAPYTIQLEFNETNALEDSNLMPPYLKDASETWNIEPIDDAYTFSWLLSDGRQDVCPYKFRVNHEVSAQGKAAYNSNGLIKQSWEWAKQHVTGLLGYDHNKVSHQGIVTFDSDVFGQFNHSRSHVTDENEGTFSVQESWLVVETGAGNSGIPANALETFDIEINKSVNNGLTRGVINGEIKGLNSISLTGTDIIVNESAYVAASGYWNEIRNRLLQRVELVGNDTATRSFNPIRINASEGHNICNGTISYTYEYNDRPTTCVPNALQEVISISDNNPVDVFATLIVLGRTAGPILQDIGTNTAPTRTLSIDITLNPATGCPKDGEAGNWLSQKPNVSSIINACENDLESNFSQVFKEEDSESWKAKGGVYTRTVTWKYLNCS